MSADTLTGRTRSYGKLILLAVVASCLIIAIVLIFTIGLPEPPTWDGCIELMKKVPAKYGDFEFWDVAALKNNRDLAATYEVWLEKRGGYHDIIPVDSIEYRASGGILTIVTGDLPLREIRNNLWDDYSRDSTHHDYEVWLLKPERQDSGLPGAFAIEDGLVVWSNESGIDDYLEVVTRGRPSFYGDEIAAIIERLPAGILTSASVTSVIGLGSVTAMTLAPEGKEGYRWTSITRFLDTGDIADHLAEVYIEALENDFGRAEKIYDRRNEPSPFRNFTLEKNGTEVKWSIYVDEEAMISLLFHG